MEYDIKIDKDGTKRYYKKGTDIIHRDDGPAIEYAAGNKEWLVNGKRHRLDGPAVKYANGDNSWYINGERSREYGPAVEWYDRIEWWINGIRLSPEKELILNKWWNNKNGI